MQPFKIKIACLSYADLLLRFNRRLSFLFLERERMRLKIKFPSSFAWAWDQQDLTAKQVNPGGVATSKKKKKIHVFLLQNGSELLDHVVNDLLFGKMVTSI